MNNLIAFMLVFFLFVSGFMMVGVNICDNVNRRINKQELNLAGRVITEYAGYDDSGRIVINEEAYIRELSDMISEQIVGGIFVYENNIRGVDNKGRCIADLSTENLTETNVVSAINNILYELTAYDSGLESINIACSDDYIKSKLFSSIEGVSVFSVTCTQRNGNYTYNVVGYCIFPLVNI